MAQVLVNFRLDEDIKKKMEQACRDMGLNMTTAFTIFATRVGKEKRIPFEITADPHSAEHYEPPYGTELRHDSAEVDMMFVREKEQLELLWTQIRLSLTAIHTAIPASVTGLSMERIRLLCGDALKDKTTAATTACRNVFSARNAQVLKEKDSSILTEYMDALSALAEDIRVLEHTLVPVLKSWSGGDGSIFELYAQRLAVISQEFDELQSVLQRFLRSTAHRHGSTRAVQARIRQAALPVVTTYVRTALERLDALVAQHYDALEQQTKTHLESFYLQTLELTLQELVQAEQSGEDTDVKASLCLRAVSVLSQVISQSRQTQREYNARNLEAEVVALERLAAMHGDIAAPAKPEP